jgi:hypothetical protein
MKGSAAVSPLECLPADHAAVVTFPALHRLAAVRADARCGISYADRSIVGAVAEPLRRELGLWICCGLLRGPVSLLLGWASCARLANVCGFASS